MSGAKVITMCLWNRPQYLREVLAALGRCAGIGDYTLLPSVEPGCPETWRLLREVRFCACRPILNPHRLGVNRNTEKALACGFEGAGAAFVIHVEEDVLLAPDALRYFEWAAAAYRDDPRVLSVTGYHRLPALPPEAEWHATALRRWFHPWGWGTWRDRFDAFRPTLCADRRATWDTAMSRDYRAPRGMMEVYPRLSRCQNIGLESSLHRLPSAWFAEHHHVPVWAGDVAAPPGEFRPGEEEPL